MKRTAIALLTAGLVLAGSLAGYAADPRTLTVTGTGSVTAAADTATLYVVIETKSDTAAQAARDNADTAARVRNAVIAAGASSDGFSTANYTLYPEYDPKGELKPAAYHAQNSMKVEVKDLARTGQVSDAALHAGASRIGSVVFSLSDEKAYKDRALRAAAGDARAKADAIAGRIGCTVAGVLDVSTQTVSAAPYGRSVMNMAADAAPGTTLSPDKQEITATVSVTYEIA